MIDWKRKLTSRKFWTAIIGLVSGLLLLFKVDAETIDRICGVVISTGSVVAYIVGEGMTDASHEEVQLIEMEHDTAEEDEDVGEV